MLHAPAALLVMVAQPVPFAPADTPPISLAAPPAALIVPHAVPGQAGSCALVMPTPNVRSSPWTTPEWTRPEYTRRDAALAYRPVRPVTAADYWPQPPVPSVTNTHRVYLDQRANQSLHFLPAGSPGNGLGSYPARGFRPYGPARHHGWRY